MMNDSEIFDFDIFTFWLTRSTIISELGSLYTVSNILSKNSDETWTGKTPIFKQLALKISAKKLEITHLNP